MDRPKVRFSKSAEIVEQNAKVTNSVSNGKKVKIKSIVPVNLPIKVSSNGKYKLIKGQPDDKQDINNDPRNTGECLFNIPSINVEYCNPMCNNSQKLCSNLTGEGRYSPTKEDSADEDSVSNCTDELQMIMCKKLPNETHSVRQIRENNTCKDSMFIKSSSDQLNESSVSYESFKSNLIENKENFTKSDAHIDVPFTSTVVLKDTTSKYCNVSKNVPIKKPVKERRMTLMPCAKYKLSEVKNNCRKKSLHKDVKKSTLFNIAESKCNATVLPGMSKTCCENVTGGSDELIKRKNIQSKDTLSRPEYNTTISIMKKLKQLNEEKLISNFEHLPQDYKNLLYGKVSAALDFAPYENVYKDLINLSVDDDKLPTRLMRSKDPEPRHKDIVPKLSNFYTPKFTEQYFRTVNPIIVNPENVNILSAFTISNKMHSWKIHRDHFLFK